jgi:hypothetical protein
MKNCEIFINVVGRTLQASPPVLTMWFQRVKFILKTSNCASLAQEIGFSAPNSCSMLCPVNCIYVGTAYSCRHRVAPPKKSVINWTWLRRSISDWSIVLIGPGGLLLVFPTYMQFQSQFYRWGCQKKKKQLNLNI